MNSPEISPADQAEDMNSGRSIWNTGRWNHCREFLLIYLNSHFPRTLRRNVGVSDVVQSALLTVARQRQRFRGSTQAEFESWLCKIAQRKLIDRIRKYRLRSVRPGKYVTGVLHASKMADEDSPSVEASLREDALLLARAIAELPDDIRSIVLLHHGRNRTLAQIATELAIPKTTCRRRWLEGLEMLRVRLQPLIGEATT